MLMPARKSRGFLSLIFLLSLCRLAFAHPMGNFSVNYFIDLAEIPTYQELQQANLSASAIDPNSTAVLEYVSARGAELGHDLIIEVNGKQTPLHLVSSGVIFSPGAGGLPTMKMGFLYEATYLPALSKMDRQRVSIHY